MKARAAAFGVVAIVCACLVFGGGASGSTATAPANDNFANAVVLSGQNVSRTGDTNVDATLETGESATVAGSPGGASVWYSWTAPADGLVRVDTLASDFDTMLGVYTGSSVGALTDVASDDDCCGGLTSRVRFPATTGTTYRIRVDGFSGATGNVGLAVFETQGPANDAFSASTAISGQDVSRESDSNEGATLEAGEPTTVAGVPAGASIWYSWTAPIDGQVTLDTTGSNFDTLLSASTGNPVDSLTTIASGDDVKSASTSLVRFFATATTVYRIRVDGFDGDTGTVHLHLHEIPPPTSPVNDNFANAIVLSGMSASRTGDTNVGATTETNEATTVASAPVHNSVWYSWKAPVDGQFTLDTSLSTFDTVLAVYTGSSPDQDALTEIASNDDGFFDLTSSVTFDAKIDTIYRIRVDGYAGDTGTVNLHLGFFAAPDAPTNVTAAAGVSSATVSWTAPNDGGTPIIGYEVTALTGGFATTTTVGPVTQTTVTGLTNGTTYTFKVTAVNSLGPGQQSAESNAVTPQKLSQTIAVTIHAPTDADFGSSFSVAATAPGGTVTFSSAGACSNVGSLFTMTSGTGTCSVRYDQAGSADYNAAPQVVETVTAHKIDQTITVTTHAPASAAFGSSFSVAATAPGGTVTFSSSGACSNVGSMFTMTSGAGTCSVRYDQTLSPNYNAAPQVVEAVTAQKADQSIAVTQHAPPSAGNGSSFTVTATAPAGAVTYSSAGVCSNIGATFTITNKTGICTVQYDQAGSADYNAASQVTESVTATRTAQTISVTTHAPASAAFGSSFSVAATGGGSGNPVTFSSAGACTNVGSLFTMTTGTGTCSVQYDQAGSTEYDDALQVVESVTATKLGQTISVSSHAPSGAAFGSSFSVAATGGGSGNPVTLSNTGVCSRAGSTFTMTSGTGTCSVQYDQAGDTNYAAATQVVESVTAQKLSQTITVTTHAPASGVSGTSFSVAATAVGGTVTFSASGSCTSSGATFTLNGVGTCSVKYDQGGNANYSAAPQVVESVATSARTFTLNVTKSGTGSGTVTGSVGGISCGATCSATVTSGTVITLSTSPDSGSTFGGWSGACSGVGSCTVTVTSDQTVAASFTAATSSPPPPPAKKVYCVVPNVKGKTLAAAKRKLTAAHCRAGKTTTAKSKTVKKGNVISQSPKAGRKLAKGSKVSLVVSRGRR